MFYTVTFYLLTVMGEQIVSVTKYKNYDLYSTVPIIECTGNVIVNEPTNERSIKHVCETEKLYYFMTGEEHVVITTTGIYKT